MIITLNSEPLSTFTYCRVIVIVLLFLSMRSSALRTKDAFRPGEFTATIRTEQYRDLLRAEKKMLEQHRDPEKEKDMLKV